MSHIMERVRPFKILVAGYININVIDGSAFFLAGVSSMLAGCRAVSVQLVTANPVERTEVLDEILGKENIEIVDPYSPSSRSKFDASPTGRSMSRESYASIVAQLGQRTDSILLRDTETASIMLTRHPELAEKLHVYVTGITSSDLEISETVKLQLQLIEASGASFVCQTSVIVKRLCELLPHLDTRRIAVLPPHVPDPEGPFEELFHNAPYVNRFSYTGKFFKDWNTDKILSSFKALNIQNNNLVLDVAGDQFRNDPEDPHFVANNRWLLESTPGVIWHGRVPRAVSRDIIEGSHVGISWRSEKLDNSAELSTKVLEYGALGRPSIINRTKLHEELFGNDYPLYANSMTEFKKLLVAVQNDHEAVKEAARRCYVVAKNHSYSGLRSEILEALGNRPKLGKYTEIAPASVPSFNRLIEKYQETRGRVFIDGNWCMIQQDDLVAESVGEQLRALLFDYAVSEQVDKQLDTKKRLLLPSYSKPSSGASDSAVSADGSSPSALERLQDAERRNNNLKNQLDVAEKRLKALRQSKLGRLQLMIWNSKKGTPSTPMPKDDKLLRVANRINNGLKSVGENKWSNKIVPAFIARK